jgi:hypothetical protein
MTDVPGSAAGRDRAGGPFLASLAAIRPRSLAGLPEGLALHGVFLGQGNPMLEVLALHAPTPPRHRTLRQVWKDRQQGRAAPLLAVALHGDGATVCGPAGDDPRIFVMQSAQAERICRRALEEPDRNAALRYLQDALPASQTDTALPGFRNEGLLTDHVLRQHEGLPGIEEARRLGAAALKHQDAGLLHALGFGVERLDAVTSVLRADGQKRAVAVLLRAEEVEEVPAERFQRASPIAWALERATHEGLPWVVMVQRDRVRLYPRDPSIGVGRRGRTETWIEVRTDLIRQDQAALLWLVFSAAALREGGTVAKLLADSKDFAADLAARLRERIYDRVVPLLAAGITEARGLKAPTADDLRLTYAMAVTVLFRLLFIAYAEDRELLPYRGNDSYRHRALKTKAREMHGSAEAPGGGTALWHEVSLLFDAVREGNSAWGVPAYGGRLFETAPAVSSAGAELARIALPDAVFAPALRALLLDETRDLAAPGAGPVDFRSLRVREFGTIYEGLLESELAVAETDLALRRQGKEEVYVPARSGESVAIPRGGVYLHDRSGARKSSGSYFTPGFAVDHLLDAALAPALVAHAERIAALSDDADAADAFFDIRIADIAMGSGHFLVAAMDRVEQVLSSILVQRPLPGVEAELSALREAAAKALGPLAGTARLDRDALLRRQIALRCIYGVDLNPLAVDLARLSLWVHSFVPGLPLALLDEHLVEGNALVGIATRQEARSRLTALAGVGLAVDPDEMLARADPHLVRLARTLGTTRADVEEARRAHNEAREAVAPVRALCDAAVAVGLGRDDLRIPVNEAIARLAAAGRPLDLRGTAAYARIRDALEPLKPFHFPVDFADAFHRSKRGFDVILGNPPWEKLRTEQHEFWARHFPGLRGIKSTAERDAALRKLTRERPDLVALEAKERKAGEILRNAVRALPGMNTGHPDLFRAFAGRFVQLVAGQGGHFGVVLPGEAFKVKGNAPVRAQLDAAAKRVDVQMLTNRGEWVFEGVDGRKLVALVAVHADAAGPDGCTYVLRPEFHRDEHFTARERTDAVRRPAAWLRAYSEGLVQPTLPTAPAARSVGVIEALMRSPRMGAHPVLRVRRVYADVETTRDKDIYGARAASAEAWPVYGGDSFDLWVPDTGTYYARAEAAAALERVQRKRAGSPAGSPYAALPRRWRDDSRTHPCLRPRIAYRDITNRTNTRTLIAALVPARCILVQSAPWLLWLDSGAPTTHEAFLLGIMSSLVADWWMRRFVETHVEEAAFNALPVPAAAPSSGLAARAVTLAGRLAAPDDRFAAWAKAIGVEHGPLDPATKQAMIEELDAVVARLYGLVPDQLAHIFDTFHEWPREDDRQRWAARRDRTLAILHGLA